MGGDLAWPSNAPSRALLCQTSQRKHPPTDPSISCRSLDCEGFDLDVLQSLATYANRPMAVAAENFLWLRSSATWAGAAPCTAFWMNGLRSIGRMAVFRSRLRRIGRICFAPA
jgi:hypothetical protein